MQKLLERLFGKIESKISNNPQLWNCFSTYYTNMGQKSKVFSFITFNLFCDRQLNMQRKNIEQLRNQDGKMITNIMNYIPLLQFTLQKHIFLNPLLIVYIPPNQN